MQCVVCRSGDQARRELSRQRVRCVVCGVRLPDGPVEWLLDDLPDTCPMLLVGPRNRLESCAGSRAFQLATPVSREEAEVTVRLLVQFSHHLEHLLRPRRSAGEQELVERAKRALMEAKGLTEEEAHRLLQKRSMDAGSRLTRTARQVLEELASS